MYTCNYIGSKVGAINRINSQVAINTKILSKRLASKDKADVPSLLSYSHQIMLATDTCLFNQNMRYNIYLRLDWSLIPIYPPKI